MSSADVRLGIIGLGDFGREHVAAALTTPGVEVVAVADVVSGRADQVASTHHILHAFNEPLGLIRSGLCDAVSIVTPAASHVELTREAVQHGLGVLLEKPVVASAGDADELRAIAAAGIVVPAHLLRFADPYRSLRDRAGTPFHCGGLTARRYRSVDHLERFPTLDPVLMTMIHDIDLAIWITGSRAVSVVARTTSVRGTGHSDLTVALVRDAHGRMWDLGAAWLLTGNVIPDRLEVYTSHDIVTLAPNVILDPAAALCAQLDHFAECIRSQRPSSIITLDEALHGVAIAVAVRESAARDGESVSVAA